MFAGHQLASKPFPRVTVGTLAGQRSLGGHYFGSGTLLERQQRTIGAS